MDVRSWKAFNRCSVRTPVPLNQTILNHREISKNKKAKERMKIQKKS